MWNLDFSKPPRKANKIELINWVVQQIGLLNSAEGNDFWFEEFRMFRGDYSKNRDSTSILQTDLNLFSLIFYISLPLS